MDIVTGFDGSPASWRAFFFALGIAQRERAFSLDLRLSRPCASSGRAIGGAIWFAAEPGWWRTRARGDCRAASGRRGRCVYLY